MLYKPKTIIYEKRAIERRGKKRASPLIEMSLSYRETVLSELLALQEYISNGSVDFGDTLKADVTSLLTDIGHLYRQVSFKRRNKQ